MATGSYGRQQFQIGLGEPPELRSGTGRVGQGEKREALQLPNNRQAGPKLIHRSIATIVRRRIGESNWRQGEIMLGHAAFAISDIYAIPGPDNLGLALAATEAVIDEIEALAPGAFYRKVTAQSSNLARVK